MSERGGVHPIEVEVKYKVSKGDLFQRLTAMKSMGSYTLEWKRRQFFVDTYLDTADNLMERAGFACRVRNVAHRRTLTVKSLEEGVNGIHQRREYECALPPEEGHSGAKADIVSWPDCPAVSHIKKITGENVMRDLLTLRRLRKSAVVLDKKRAILLLSLDEAYLNLGTSDGKRHDLIEIEAELIEEGTMDDLTAFTETFRSLFSLEPATESKFTWALSHVRSTSHSEERIAEDPS